MIQHEILVCADIPPLEARNTGCVVASSNANSILEVVGDAAVTYEPSDIDDSRFALERACFNDTIRQQLLAAGVKRVRACTWGRCARDTVAAYRKLISA